MLIAVPSVKDAIVHSIVDTKLFQANAFALRLIEEEQLFKI
jgi:hypothetical protein